MNIKTDISRLRDLMSTIETKYGIEDVVYTATASSVDRKIIKAIKITKQGVQYGFPSRNDLFMLYMGDGYGWWKESDIFSGEEDARRRSKELEVEAERKKVLEKEEKAKEIAADIERQKDRLARLEAGEDVADEDEDDND